MTEEKSNRKFKTIIVDEDLHYQLKIIVAQKQITLNQFINRLFDSYKTQNLKK